MRSCRRIILKVSSYVFTLILPILLAISCASRWSLEHYSPILGEWVTERDIVMVIRMTPDRSVAASVRTPTGFDVDSIQAGPAVITEITPLADGGYSGKFVMPGGEKPVKVKLGLITHERLVIITWDGRVRDKVMEWRRNEKKRQ